MQFLPDRITLTPTRQNVDDIRRVAARMKKEASRDLFRYMAEKLENQSHKLYARSLHWALIQNQKRYAEIEQLLAVVKVFYFIILITNCFAQAQETYLDEIGKYLYPEVDRHDSLLN